jgi:CTP:molybdopterin cytidylyltransferase MocA
MRVVLFAQILFAFGASEAVAAPCIAPPLSPAAIEQFKANPDALVAPDADTRTIEAQVRDLAGTDPSLATDVVRLARTTSPRFRTAIAAGLAQAAVACQTVDQGASLSIQQAVASFDEEGFQSAFAAVSGDLSTAATIAATNSANASVGSVVVVNPTSGGRAATNPGGGGSTGFFLINSGTAVSPTTATTPTNTTTSGNPVSATQ